MNRYTIPLGRLYGIPVGLDPSWFLIFVLITWTLATSYFPEEYRAATRLEHWLLGAVTAILLFGSVLLHELGHSLVALRYHIPVKKITLYVFGGVAQISSELPNPSAEFWIALAGPAVSLALAGFFWGIRQVSAGWAPLLALAKYLSLINASLALFNLVPGFPLDGGRVFRAFIWKLTHNLRRATLVRTSDPTIMAAASRMRGSSVKFRSSSNFRPSRKTAVACPGRRCLRMKPIMANRMRGRSASGVFRRSRSMMIGVPVTAR